MQIGRARRDNAPTMQVPLSGRRRKDEEEEEEEEE
jgi:hypothetical protein